MKNSLKFYVITFFGSLFFVTCSSSKKELSSIPEQTPVQAPLNNPLDSICISITKDDLKKHISVLASDEFQGRMTGEEGQKKTSAYLADYYKKLDVSSPISPEDYFQEVPADYLPKGIKESENVLAYFPGTDGSGEHVVITAHLDHIGTKEGKVYNGADDNGSGTAALLELAEALKLAEQKGFKPKKGILFLHVTAEELGLIGSNYYIEDPVLPFDKIICNINLDMIGRKDNKNKKDPNYLYSIGSDRISKELHTTVFDVLKKHKSDLKIDLFYDKPDEPMQLYYRSDHYNFAKRGVPSVFFFSGLHDDYHQPSDDVEKLEFDAYEKRVRYLFSLLWEIANRTEKFK